MIFFNLKHLGRTAKTISITTAGHLLFFDCWATSL